jgi:hypothetical protein
LINSLNVVTKLVDRYDYGGALEMLVEQGLENTNPAILMDSCRYAVNFDFKSAKKKLSRLSDDMRRKKEIQAIERNLNDLVKGEPSALFSELLENIKFQVVNEQYIDFLGRLYRLKEAIFKYMFALKTMGRADFLMTSPAVSKKNILKILRNQYKIYNSNLVFALTTFFNRNMKVDYNYAEIIRILNSDKMNNLIELRNDSIVGHGFIGVSIDDIYKMYGNPYNVLDDFRKCLTNLDIDLLRFKYSEINLIIKDELVLLNSSLKKSSEEGGYSIE